MHQGLAALLALSAGVAAGAAYGSPHAAILCALGLGLFGAVLFSLKLQAKPPLLLLVIACFAVAEEAVGLRWFTAGLCSNQALGAALGILVAAVVILALSSTTVFSVWAAAVLFRRVRTAALYIVLLCSAQLLGNWLRELILPSFPWLSVAYTQADSPFAVLLPLVGAQGTGLVLELSALTAGALIASLWTRETGRLALFACLLAVALCLAGARALVPVFARDAVPVRIAIMQTALSTREKFTASRFKNRLTDIVDFAQTHDAQLIVTPETALPASLDALDPDQLQHLQSAVTATRMLILGTFSQDSRGDTFNSAVLMRRPEAGLGVERSTYIKRHLAPLGEYTPPGFRWLAGLLDLPFADITATGDARIDFAAAGLRIVPSICLDLLYGADLRPTGDAPHLLVNLSNPAFFSSTVLSDQYLAIGRIRALEMQSPLLIAANFGPSAVIDGTGKILGSLPLGTSGALQLEVRPRFGATPYARWGGDFSLGLQLLALAALLAAFAQSLHLRARVGK